jgi:hypothetical protein
LSLALLAACGTTNTSSKLATPTISVSPISTPEATPCSVEGATEDRKSAPSDGRPTAPVTDVRPSGERCPRVVFEFRDHVPGYRVEYATGPFSQCASGQEVSTRSWGASAFLRVRLEPSGSVDDRARQTYAGPSDMAGSGKVLKHLKVVCDFEAVYEWIIGLDSKHAFAVTTFDGPPRLVIDVNET